MASVAKRSYRSPLREQQASDTRARIVRAAGALFAEHGYAATSIRQIAARADVAVETVKAQGSKISLLFAALELAGLKVEGLEDDITLEHRARALLNVGKDDIPDAVAGLIVAIQAPQAPIYRALVSAAATDAEAKQMLSRLTAQIRRRWHAVFTLGLERGWLATDEPLGLRIDAWCWSASPDAYQRLVVEYGWTEEQYQRHIAKSLQALLAE